MTRSLPAPAVGETTRKVAAELIGSALLAATVVGSGIAAQTLSPDDVGLQLLENALIIGAVLVALILALGPVSAAFQPGRHARRARARVRSRARRPPRSLPRRSSGAASAS